MKKSILGLIAGFFLLSLPNAMARDINAGTDDMKASVRQACQNDIQQFCTDIKPGEGRLPMCLKSHSDKISEGCKNELAKDGKEWGALMANLYSACGGQIQKLCNQFEFGDVKGIMTCLGDHSSELSNTCRTFQKGQTQ